MILSTFRAAFSHIYIIDYLCLIIKTKVSHHSDIKFKLIVINSFTSIMLLFVVSFAFALFNTSKCDCDFDVMEIFNIE